MLRPVTDKEIKEIILRSHHFMGRCDWDDLGFALPKAALGAILSQIAYCAVRNDEREAATRAKLVPSELFQRIVAAGTDIDIATIAAQAELRVEIVSTATLVAAVVKRSDLVLIAIRGTQFMYEWKIDAQADKWHLRDDDHFLHTGFFKDALTLSARLHRALRAYSADDAQTVRIAIFGHSLGGAVAAILKLWGIEEIGGARYDGYAIDHCYTYGAPRIASERLVTQLRTYAVRRAGDLVPSVPPTAMGYADYLEQFTCSGLDWRARTATVGMLTHLGNKIRRANPVSQHSIEGYRDDLIRAIDNA